MSDEYWAQVRAKVLLRKMGGDGSGVEGRGVVEQLGGERGGREGVEGGRGSVAVGSRPLRGKFTGVSPSGAGVGSQGSLGTVGGGVGRVFSSGSGGEDGGGSDSESDDDEDEPLLMAVGASGWQRR